MDIKIGESYTIETVVDDTNIATRVESGSLGVFATPMMIAQMEKAATKVIAKHLTEEQSSVGVSVNIEHMAATLPGETVTTTAVVCGVDGRKVDFTVESKCGDQVIGKGLHGRFVVDVERFMDKAKQLAKKT